MTLEMAFPAQPYDLKWLIVIFMMLLGILASAVDARLPFEFSPSLISIRIRPTVHFLSLVCRERMCLSELTHRGGMVFIAVTSRLAAWLRAEAACIFHLESVPLKQTWNIFQNLE